MSTLLSTIIQPGLLVATVVVIHASLQAGISVLTLLSGHSFRRKQHQSKLMRLSISYILGAVAVNLLLIILSQNALRALDTLVDLNQAWSVVSIVMAIVGIIIITSYYRVAKGTVLWLPRSLADYLSTRAKKTRNSIESTMLGGAATLAEVPFSLILIVTIGLLTFALNPGPAMIYALAYSISVCIPLIIMAGMIGGGTRVSQIQRWREQNKIFFKYMAGIGIFMASMYIISFYIMGVSV